MASRKPRRIAVMTAGGDCPGLNAVIRAVTKSAIHDHGLRVLGISDGFAGLVEGRFRDLVFRDCSGILQSGGTILGSSNSANPFKYPANGGGYEDRSSDVKRALDEAGVDALVCIGGDGTLRICRRLLDLGIEAVVVPKTIDNDVPGTELTVGYDSALNVATDAVDRLHSTAASHHRTMVVEVMGRDAGWIALGAGAAGGGDVILLPEIPFRMEPLAEEIRRRSEQQSKCSIVVVAEGARLQDGEKVVQRFVADPNEPARLGGIGNLVADRLEQLTGIAARTTVLGHVQRGGPPTPSDRILGTVLGAAAVELVMNGRLGRMVGVAGGRVVNSRFDDRDVETRFVPLDHPLVRAARSVGTLFGDEANGTAQAQGG